ncbi:GIY-YIG nuclease family protein [candidate division KSB1 bacterium]|nr:GIY-YIG nuclease family protein [candidate division KSB1 bacterium]
MPHMYILRCSDGSYYTGSTKNLEKRLWEHQNGLGAKHTKKRLPVKLVYCEEYDRVDNAFYREKQVQGWSRKKKEALINGEFEKLPELAKNYTQFGAKVASTGSATGRCSTTKPKVP